MEAYYEAQIAQGVDDYYAGRGESPGIWAGGAAAELGLGGGLGDGELGLLLRGTDPSRGSCLRSPTRGRTITVDTIEPVTGELVVERKRLAPVAGFDLVFSAPKSVSVLHALTADEGVRRAISEAHEASWHSAFEYLEREACVVRRGKGGAVRERGAGFVAAAFRHRTSRAQDPHLHTHVIVANMTRAGDGKWLSLDGRAILQTHRLAAGYLYEAQLRHELSTRLGVTWAAPVKGMAELSGMPPAAIGEFSTRRRSLVEHMRERGLDGFHAARLSALATREPKTDINPTRLRQDWQARAASHGLTPSAVHEMGTPSSPAWARSDQLDPRALAPQLFGPNGITQKRTTFTTPELVRAVAQAHQNGAPAMHVLAATTQLLEQNAVTQLEPDGVTPGVPGLYTTTDLIALEQAALQIAQQEVDAGAPTVSKATIERAISTAPIPLSAEQQHLVRQAASRPDRVVAIIGPAGSGKTTALNALRAAYQHAGTTVLGAAPTGRAADELQTQTGIPTTTMHRLLHHTERHDGLPRRCVLVIDEAGMADTRTLTPLLQHIQHAQGKAILVGDPKQLPSVGAGGLYHELCNQLDIIELSENRRQTDPAERHALAQLRANRPLPYLQHATATNRISSHDNPLDAKHQLLNDWWQTAQHDLPGSVMIAHRTRDVHDLNHAARELMTQHNQLGTLSVKLGGRDYRVGDRIICKRNNQSLHVRNGTRGTITALDTENLTITTDTGHNRLLPHAYARDHLDYAYATTAHAIQGATLNHTHVLLDPHTLTKEWAYTTLTRARHTTHLYTHNNPAQHDQATPGPDPRTANVRLAHSMQRPSPEQGPAITHGLGR